MAVGDIRGFIEVARDELRCPARLAGMGLYWAWLQIIFSSAALAPAVLLPLPLAPQHQIWTASLLTTIVVFLVVLLYKPARALRSPRAALASSFCMAGGSLALALSSASGDPLPFAATGVLGIGVGSALAFLCWGLHLARLVPRRVLFDMSVFAFSTALFFGLVAPLPPGAVQACAVLMPLASGALLGVANRDSAPVSHNAETSASKPDGPHDRVRARRSGGLLGLAVLVGLVYGIMRGITLAFGTSTVEATTVATVIGVAASGVLLLATTVFYRRESELYLVCEISFPLLVAGFLLLPQYAGPLPLPIIVFTVGHGYFYFLLWVFCVDQSQAQGRDPLRVFSAGLLAFLGSSLAGSLASDALALSGFESSGVVGIVSLVIVYAFVLAFAVLFGRTRSERMREAKEADEQRRAEFEQCAALVARDGGLTARESEIFLLLARDESRAVIRDQLCISNDTVKTHTRRVYTKLDIHAKQEARALVEARMERERRGM